MLACEWLATAFFVALAVSAIATPISWRTKAVVMAIAASTAALIMVAVSRLPLGIRVWLPHLYLVLGYWLPARLTVPPESATRFERWLVRIEAAMRPRLPPVPRSLVHVVELAYLLCYPLVPAAFAIVWTRGSIDLVDRFWTAVLASGYCCYATLPWLVSRPPRVIETNTPPQGMIRGVNLLVLQRASHSLNTFPSGHVAVSCAAALSVAALARPAGVVLGLAAIAIAVGAVTGRYHYVIDVVVGVVVSAAVVWLTS